MMSAFTRATIWGRFSTRGMVYPPAAREAVRVCAELYVTRAVDKGLAAARGSPSRS